jgi:hypothetical protein
MALPVVPLGTGTVVIGGETVAIKSLSRADALQLNGFKGREDEAEVFVIMCGTGCTADEAKAFREGNDTETAGLLIDAILELSGLTDSPKA